MESKKLSQEELKQLTELQEKRNQITFNLGKVDIQKAILEGQRNLIIEELTKLQEDESAVGKNLQEKYGDGNINLDTGEFTKTE